MATKPTQEIASLIASAKRWAIQERRERALRIRHHIKLAKEMQIEVVQGGPTLQKLQKARQDQLSGMRRLLKMAERPHEFSIKADFHQYLLVHNQDNMNDTLGRLINVLVTKTAGGTVEYADLAEYLLSGGRI